MSHLDYSFVLIWKILKHIANILFFAAPYHAVWNVVTRLEWSFRQDKYSKRLLKSKTELPGQLSDVSFEFIDSGVLVEKMQQIKVICFYKYL